MRQQLFAAARDRMVCGKIACSSNEASSTHSEWIANVDGSRSDSNTSMLKQPISAREGSLTGATHHEMPLLSRQRLKADIKMKRQAGPPANKYAARGQHSKEIWLRAPSKRHTPLKNHNVAPSHRYTAS